MNARGKVGYWAIMGMLALAACDSAADGDDRALPGEPAAPPTAGEPSASMRATTDWQLDLSQRGGARLLHPASAIDAGRDPVVILTCVPSGRLIVRLPRVAPIPSEERLSIGSGGDVIAFVADTGPEARSAAARGPLPLALDRMLESGFAAAYGATSVGALPPVPADMRARWRSACS